MRSTIKERLYTVHRRIPSLSRCKGDAVTFAMRMLPKVNYRKKMQTKEGVQFDIPSFKSQISEAVGVKMQSKGVLSNSLRK